ncbi:metallophosphoesterase family protein [Desulfosporosinus sp. BG]|uniref:metallophosphoesterase family protein n=1 Tax=Desulfosporosinus sp. BG TaxID=1633135 RepID=UPI00083A2285|nr:metallophosphoesterase family protein [Desulfosporosinus sp. BG]ODA39398.1 putative phosphoesterase [Desulfosporosinus sp. BG]
MRIAVLSDTHLRVGKSLPRFVWEHLTEVDMIIHAGDLTHMGLLEELASIAPVRAVRGNCDGWDVSLPDRDVIECGAWKIGLVHGNVGKGNSTPDRAYAEFKETPVNLIVFGHSHTPFMEWRNGILLFNPGSPTDKRREPQYSFGLLDIQQEQIDAKHLYF